METKRTATPPEMDRPEAEADDEPRILEEIEVEELAIDGICGVY